METTVDKLEALIRKAESDLNFMTCKLEVELSTVALKGTGMQLNPLKMIQSVQELRNEYDEVVLQFRELQKAQKEVYEQLQKEMQTACKKLQELEDRTGVPLNSQSKDIF